MSRARAGNQRNSLLRYWKKQELPVSPAERSGTTAKVSYASALPIRSRTSRRHWIESHDGPTSPSSAESGYEIGLTDHFALIADAALAFVCESLYACEN